MPFSADPHWGWWIIAYFYMGGIAAGAYFISAVARMVGSEEDRRVTRGADYLALPLVGVCGILLIADLDSPWRFWHMLIQPETGRPAFKFWSPMSIGAWALTLFGLFAGLSFVSALADDGCLGLGRFAVRIAAWRKTPAARLARICGAAVGAFVASYTGVLLAATNQPIWSDTTWLGALFLTSAASSGAAALMLWARFTRPPASRESMERLARTDAWAIVLELIVLAAFLMSLGGVLRPFLAVTPAMILLASAAIGMFAPLVLHVIWRGRNRVAALVSPLLVLAGGLLLRMAVVAAASAMRTAG